MMVNMASDERGIEILTDGPVLGIGEAVGDHRIANFIEEALM